MTILKRSRIKHPKGSQPEEPGSEAFQKVDISTIQPGDPPILTTSHDRKWPPNGGGLVRVPMGPLIYFRDI